MWSAQVHTRDIEHDLPAESELRLRWCVTNQLLEDFGVLPMRRSVCFRRPEMRCAHQDVDAVLPETAEHRDGDCEQRRAIVDTG